MSILKVLSNASWDADCESLLKIYRTVICSKLDYACQNDGFICHSYLKKLDTIHFTALQICCGAFRTSPVMSPYADCAEPSLTLIREQLSLELYFRILSHPHHNYLTSRDYDIHYHNHPSCIPTFGLRIRNMLEGSSLLDIRVCPRSLLGLTPCTFKSVSCLHPFNGFDKSNINANIFNSLLSLHCSNYNNFIDMYTDGSKTSNIVGCGIICENIIFSYHLPNCFFIFSFILILSVSWKHFNLSHARLYTQQF